MARSPRGSRSIQCVNNPGTCTANYPLPSAGFIEPAPEFLCATCKVPRVKIVFRGQRRISTASTRNASSTRRRSRIGVCPNCGSPLREYRYSFRGNRTVGCTSYPKCTVTYPLPQRGRLDKDQPPSRSATPPSSPRSSRAVPPGRSASTRNVQPGPRRRPRRRRGCSRRRRARSPPAIGEEGGRTAARGVPSWRRHPPHPRSRKTRAKAGAPRAARRRAAPVRPPGKSAPGSLPVTTRADPVAELRRSGPWNPVSSSSVSG